MTSISTDKNQLSSIGPEVLVGLGLGSNGAWVSMAFKSLTLYGSAPDGTSKEPVLDAIYLISIVAVCLTLAVCAALEKRTWRLLAHFPVYVALAAGVSATTVLMPFGSPSGTELQQLALICAGVFSGIFSGVFLVYLGIALSQLTLKGKVTAAATSTIFASLLFVLFNVLHPNLAIPLAALMPIASAVLLMAGMTGATLETPVTPTEIKAAGNRHTGFPTAFTVAIARCKPPASIDSVEKRAWIGLVARIAVASLLVGFAAEAARTLYMQMDLISAGQYAYAAVQAVDSLIVTVAVVALALLLVLRRTERMAKNCYFAICILLATGILMLPAPLLIQGINSFLPLAVSSAAYNAFDMFIWILTACICGSLPQNTISAFASIRAAWAIGPLIGIIVGRSILSVEGLSVTGAYQVLFVALLALVIVATFVFSSEDLGKIMAIVPTRTQQRFRRKCELVAKRYGLTERESEIMMMLAKGRNLPFIQDQLFLSKSTVSTHRQHIYQKLGIHSQQELIDLVQAAE